MSPCLCIGLLRCLFPSYLSAKMLYTFHIALMHAAYPIHFNIIIAPAECCLFPKVLWQVTVRRGEREYSGSTYGGHRKRQEWLNVFGTGLQECVTAEGNFFEGDVQWSLPSFWPCHILTQNGSDRFSLLLSSDSLFQTIAKTKLIPMTLMEVEERVNSFKHLGEEICRNIPDVLLATMNMLYVQYNKTRYVCCECHFCLLSDVTCR